MLNPAPLRFQRSHLHYSVNEWRFLEKSLFLQIYTLYVLFLIPNRYTTDLSTFFLQSIMESILSLNGRDFSILTIWPAGQLHFLLL